MGLADIIIVAVIVALVALSVRYLLRSNKNGCSDCGSASSCTAHATGGHCSAAERMVAHADEAFATKK